MRKGLVVLVAAVLVVAFAAPAMADLKVTGFYRAKGVVSNFFNATSGGSFVQLVQRQHDDSSAYTEQRFRIKFDAGTEVARAIINFESDMNWGYNNPAGSPGAGRNSGGALSADAVQLETKEAYLWFKVPDTSITSTVGMQMVNDHYAGIFANNARMASVFVNGEFEPVKWTLGWGKLFENNYNRTDDADMYLGSVQFAPSKDMSLGVNLYYLKDDSGKFAGTQGLGIANHTVDLYMPGVNFAMNAGAAKISAFAFYQTGRASESNGATNSWNISAYAADLRADVKAGPGNLFVEGFYISGEDASDFTAGNRHTYRSPITLGDYTDGLANANSGFTRTHMYFMFGFENQNVNQCIIGCSAPVLSQSYGNAGNGLWHVAAGYSQKFSEKIKGEFNVGYLSAVDSDRKNGYRNQSIGTEANARVDYTISKGLDLSLIGAYLNAGGYLLHDNAQGVDIADAQRNYYMLTTRISFNF